MSFVSSFNSDSIRSWTALGSTGYARLNRIVTKVSPTIISTNANGDYVGELGTEIFKRNALTYNREANNDIGGGTFDISSNTTSFAAAGNPESFSGPGRVYVMKRSGNTWTNRFTSQQIIGSQNNERMGQALQFSGDESKLVILKNDLGNIDSIAIDTYTYNGTAWTLSNTIYNGNLRYVGANIAVNEIGNRYFCTSAVASNWVEMYDTNSATWTQIFAANVPNGSQFGTFIATNKAGNILAVCAPTADNSSNTFGKIYLFKETGGTWSQTLELVPPDTPNSSMYARMLAINDSGNTLVTNLYKGAGGAYSNDTEPYGVYIYDVGANLDTASLAQIITSPNSNTRLTYGMDMNSTSSLLYVGLENIFGGSPIQIQVYGR